MAAAAATKEVANAAVNAEAATEEAEEPLAAMTAEADKAAAEVVRVHQVATVVVALTAEVAAAVIAPADQEEDSKRDLRFISSRNLKSEGIKAVNDRIGDRMRAKRIYLTSHISHLNTK